MVGFGEISPITIFGRLLAVVSVCMGIFFFAFPVIVIGLHFVISLRWSKYRKQLKSFESMLKSKQKISVLNLLKKVNKALEIKMFGKEDELVFIEDSNQLDSKLKLEEVLSCANGWAYLPFSYRYQAGAPR